MISTEQDVDSRGEGPVVRRSMPWGGGQGALVAAVLLVCRAPLAAATILPAVISSD